MAEQTGALNPNWRGGKSIASNGYVLVRSHNRRWRKWG